MMELLSSTVVKDESDLAILKDTKKPRQHIVLSLAASESAEN